MNLRRHIAIGLAFVLMAGLVVAPLTHYVWMSMAGHYAPSAWTGQHGSDRSSDMSSGMSMSTMAHTDGIGVERAHLKCDYSGLFATTVAVASTSPNVSTAETTGSPLASATPCFRASPYATADQPRAPPQV